MCDLNSHPCNNVAINQAVPIPKENLTPINQISSDGMSLMEIRDGRMLVLASIS